MTCHAIAFLLGFLLDLLLGDPYCFPHPVRLMGKLTTAAGKMLRGTGRRENIKKADQNKRELWQGIGLVCMVSVSVTAVTAVLLLTAYRIHPVVGIAVETLMTYQMLAAKCLKVESMKVYECLKNGELLQAGQAVSMIVGRDTEGLDEEGIVKAAVETVAENTSDGVIAPMLYLALGGPVFGFLYKAVNTMDSMVGYKNDKYLYFGRAAARLDDVFNFFPSRISACLMLAASFLAGRDFSGTGAWKIYKRDRRKHASPNSGQTEAVCAGALSIRLAGPASYFGKMVEKPYIGDAVRRAEYEDIRRANRLMYISAWLCAVLCLLAMLAAERML
ncbi:MAG: adenosylcobinamide-phosphate synthase CbiB [Muribaculaceae bacterium]|nr:adenosylcobinamide-phosphate synthase CbiB [Roseburia sp.]MCM1431961.1 adenosylcobinamide-phosphate synthase CbiB [Muribaculaceae bacterium]MCM1493591.1 adenosylcobinamide-phosphate synthase CbiB [Muribaculaceae bacterium]